MLEFLLDRVLVLMTHRIFSPSILSFLARHCKVITNHSTLIHRCFASCVSNVYSVIAATSSRIYGDLFKYPALFRGDRWGLPTTAKPVICYLIWNGLNLFDSLDLSEESALLTNRAAGAVSHSTFSNHENSKAQDSHVSLSVIISTLCHKMWSICKGIDTA